MVPSMASALVWSRSMPNTTRRNSGAVALYMCTVARRAPDQRLDGPLDKVVAGLGEHRDLHVVRGSWPPSISSRTKSKSVWLADGKPTSISL